MSCNDSNGYLNEDEFFDKINNKSIKVLEDSYCKFIKVKHNNKCYNRLIINFKAIINLINSFISNIAILKSKIIATTNKEMKTYLIKYKNLINNFINKLKNILSDRDGNYYLINNKFNIYNCNCIKYTKASYRNMNSINSRKEIKMIYSIPGITVEYNSSCYLLYLIICKNKYNINKNLNNKYKFIITPKINIKCNKISKRSFLNNIDDLYNFTYSKKNNINELLNFLENEICIINNI